MAAILAGKEPEKGHSEAMNKNWNRRTYLLAVLAAIARGQAARAENWPGFRGPTGMGQSDSTLPLEWDGASGKNVLWKVPLPASVRGGHPDHNQASPIVWGERVIVTTAFWPDRDDRRRVPEQHVTCYRTTDGEQLWDVVIPAGPWKLSDLRGGYCAPTPATDGERVYAVFGSSVVAAVDLTGQLLWHKEIPDWGAFDVAIAASPIVDRGRLLVLADRSGGKSTLSAYDGKTGEILWTAARPESGFGHTTPVMIEQGGSRQLLVAASGELQALDPESGKKLWWCKTPGDVTSPVMAGGRIFTDSGRGGPGIAVEAGGSGDVSGTHVKWRVEQIPEGLSSPAIVGERIYRLHNPGVLKCWELGSGREVYSTRLAGVSVASSPIVTPDGRLYFASSGKTFVVNSGPEFKLLATNDLGEPTSASAAASEGRLFLKGDKHLYCVGEKK